MPIIIYTTTGQQTICRGERLNGYFHLFDNSTDWRFWLNDTRAGIAGR